MLETLERERRGAGLVRATRITLMPSSERRLLPRASARGFPRAGSRDDGHAAVARHGTDRRCVLRHQPSSLGHVKDGLVYLAEVVAVQRAVVALGDVAEDLLLALGIVEPKCAEGFSARMSNEHCARSLSSDTSWQSIASIRARISAILACTSMVSSGMFGSCSSILMVRVTAVHAL